MKAIKWGWTGLWIILILGVLRSSMTLPVAFISVFLGRAFGSGSRWIMGYDDQRAKGAKLVEALLNIGITPSRIVRTDLDTTEEPLATWAVAENSRGRLTQMPADLGDMGVTVTRRPIQDHHRHYQAWSDTGLAYEIIAMDPGQELTGTLLEMWNNLRLRGISRWVSPSLKAQAERSSFTTLQALRAGVFTQEPIGIASASDSIILVMSALPPTTPLTELGENASDEILDRAWEQLHFAHSRGISHRALTPEAVVVDSSSDVWLLDWDSGEVATTELNQSIDIAQMLVLTALAVGPERALEAGRRCVGEDTLIACAPVIQKPVLPAEINQRLRRSDLLGELRAALVGDSEAETAHTADLQRFRPRTIFTIAVAFIAVFIVVSSLNFSDIVTTIKSANLWWMLASALLACLIWVGSAVPLVALSPEKLSLRETLVAQVAASIITIVAPRRRGTRCPQPALPAQAPRPDRHGGDDGDAHADFAGAHHDHPAPPRHGDRRILAVRVGPLRHHPGCRRGRHGRGRHHCRRTEGAPLDLVEDSADLAAGLPAPPVDHRPAPSPRRGRGRQPADEHRLRGLVLDGPARHGRFAELLHGVNHLPDGERGRLLHPLAGRYRYC